MSNVEHRGALVLIGAAVGWIVAKHAGPFTILATLAVVALVGFILFAILAPVWPAVVLVVVLGLAVAIDRRHRQRHRQAV